MVVNPTRTLSLLCLLVSTVFPAYAAPTAEIAARESAERWLKVIDAYQYGEAWARCAPFFRTQITREELIAGLEQVRTPLGAAQSRELKRLFYTTELPNAPDAHYVIVQYETKFAGRAEPVIETLTPMLIDPQGDPVPVTAEPYAVEGEWLISGYFIK